MQIKWELVVFDAPDLEVESRFWAAVYGGTVEADDEWHTVSVDGRPKLAVQLAPDHQPPEWPDGTPQQIHLDLIVEDPQAAHDEVMALGARLLKPARDVTSKEGFQVYADPAGHPFCICW